MKAVKIILTLFILGLFILLVYIIREPIIFEEEKDRRYSATIANLKAIRELQMAYKDEKGRFAESFSELLSFYKNDSMQTIKTIGDPNDTTQAVTFDTLLTPVKGNVLAADYPIDSLPLIPFTNDTFDLAAGFVDKNRVKIPVFEVRAPNAIVLKGLDKQYYPARDLQVGSLYEPVYTGNWE